MPIILIILLTAPAASTAAAPDFAALLKDQPYLQLFTQSEDCIEVKATNNLTGSALDSRLAELTRWYRHFTSQTEASFMLGDECIGTSSTTLAAKLAGVGAQVSNYRNGSYLAHATKERPMNMGEAESIEQTAALSILTWWPGNWRPLPVTGDGTAKHARLSFAIGATQTTIKVNSAGPVKPNADAAATWPYLASRGTGTQRGAYSKNTHDFVSWIRIDDEIMKITAQPTLDTQGSELIPLPATAAEDPLPLPGGETSSGGRVVLKLERGVFGTTKASHAVNSKVMSPVYIGAKGAEDWAKRGIPNRNDVNYSLRYATKIWEPGGFTWIANRIWDTFGRPDLQGHNALWLDLYSCAQYNFGDPWGNQVAAWNDPVDTKFTRDAFGDAQLAKTSGLRSLFPTTMLLGNNLAIDNACTDKIVAALDGAVQEDWLLTDDIHKANWYETMDRSFRLESKNWPAFYWVKWRTAADKEKYRRYSYGSALLSINPANTLSMLGGPWGLTKPQEMYFWDWGSPLSTPTGYAALKVPDQELYRRDFANAIIVVNPSSETLTYQLDGTYYNVLNKDTSGLPRALSQVVIGPKDAVFLLRSA